MVVVTAGRLLAVGLLLAATAPAVFAAPGQRPAPGTTFGDWRVECETASAARPLCALTQTQLLKDSNARLLKISLGYIGSNGEPMLVAVTPLGIDLRRGVAVRADEGEPLALTIVQCLQDGCIASTGLDERGVSALMKARTLHLTLLPYGTAQTLTIPVSLKGITAGLGALR